MTGAEHCAEAEAALDAAKGCDTGSALERYYLAEAQVHATLAVAASQMRSLPATQDTEGGSPAATKN